MEKQNKICEVFSNAWPKNCKLQIVNYNHIGKKETTATNTKHFVNSPYRTLKQTFNIKGQVISECVFDN